MLTFFFNTCGDGDSTIYPGSLFQVNIAPCQQFLRAVVEGDGESTSEGPSSSVVADGIYCHTLGYTNMKVGSRVSFTSRQLA